MSHISVKIAPDGMRGHGGVGAGEGGKGGYGYYGGKGGAGGAGGNVILGGGGGQPSQATEDGFQSGDSGLLQQFLDLTKKVLKNGSTQGTEGTGDPKVDTANKLRGLADELDPEGAQVTESAGEDIQEPEVAGETDTQGTEDPKKDLIAEIVDFFQNLLGTGNTEKAGDDQGDQGNQVAEGNEQPMGNTTNVFNFGGGRGHGHHGGHHGGGLGQLISGIMPFIGGLFRGSLFG